MNIDELRKRINEIDSELVRLFEARMNTAAEIALNKLENRIPVFNEEREKEVLYRVKGAVSAELSNYAERLYERMLELSREYQEKLIAANRQAMSDEDMSVSTEEAAETQAVFEEAVREESAKPERATGFGLVGRNLVYSFSKQIHERLSNYRYDIINLEPEKIEEYIKRKNFVGLNITIPYKKTVYALCDEVSDRARQIGSVNTVIVRPNGKLYGDNTDYDGFMFMAKRAGVDFHGKKSIVFGSGGTSAMVCNAIEENGGSCFVVSRTGDDNYTNLERHSDAELVVNTTPVGTYPDIDKQIVDLTVFPNCSAVLDVVYNPLNTRLVEQARSLGMTASGGLSMLVAQAKRASELFTGEAVDFARVEKVMSSIVSDVRNIILVGMPGCGKTTVAYELKKLLSREVVDLDTEIEKKAEMSVPEIFSSLGEERFRELESEVTAEVSRENGKIIATGGGAVLLEENRRNLKANGVIVYIRRDLDKLDTLGRPLSKSMAELSRIYNEREPLYSDFCDISVSNNAEPWQAAMEIKEALE